MQLRNGVSEKSQSLYLPSFANDTEIQATFAVQEATPAFNPMRLKPKQHHNMVSLA